jgi:hypothetical protein
VGLGGALTDEMVARYEESMSPASLSNTVSYSSDADIP